jgi:hypothetical protein
MYPTMEHYAATKRKEVLINATPERSPETMMLSERSQAQRGTWWPVPSV